MVEGERMSEKRFGETERNCYYTSLIFDNHTQEELGTNKVVKLLNALHDENEQLRKENQTLIQGIQDTAKQGAETITKVWESKNQPNIIKRGYYD